MSEKTAIEWTDATWNPIRARFLEIQNDGGGKERIGWHCEHVSEGCRFCYAEGFNHRLGTGRAFAPAEFKDPAVRHGYHKGEVEVFLDEKMLMAPLRWKRPRKIFVGSMTDLFARFVRDEWLDKIFAVMALCPQHIFQVLTKRPQRMRDYLQNMEDCFHASPETLEDRMGQIAVDLTNSPCAAGIIEEADVPFPNVWLGVSVENPAALSRVDDLRSTPAAKRYLSVEPLLKDLGKFDLTGIDWVICGGESGANARPMHPDWARSLRDQCAAAGVPFFFKQWGEWIGVSQMNEEMINKCYRPRVRATAWEDQGTLDEIHGKACTVPNIVQHHDGKVFDGERSASAGAFEQGKGAMTMFRVGKKRAGALLDGIEHKSFPES